LKIIDINGFGLSSPTIDSSYLGYLNNSKFKNIGIVEVITDENIVGYGETYAGVYCAELIKPTIEFLKDYLIGKELNNPQKISSLISSIPYVGRNGFFSSLSSAINIALYDILGKKMGIPTYQIFNKKKSSIKVYASNGSSTFNPKEIEEDVKSILDLGFDAYKMRVGYQTWENDLRRVEAARHILGSDNLLMVDAIMGTLNPPWSKKEAEKKINSLKDYDLYWIEEPLHPNNLNGLSELNSLFPVAGGESLSGKHEFDIYFEKKCVSYIQPDVTHSGGFDVCLDIAKKWNKTAAHVWGSGIAVLANLHFALAADIHILEIPMMTLTITDEILEARIKIEDGRIKAPDTPGIGIKITNEIKEKYKLRKDSNYRI